MDALEYESRPMSVATHHQQPHLETYQQRPPRRSSTVILPLIGPSPQLPLPAIPLLRPGPIANRVSSHRPSGMATLPQQASTSSTSSPTEHEPRATTYFTLPTLTQLHANHARQESETLPPSTQMDTLSPLTEPTRPSSRRALTEALRLAQEAVMLDSQNNDPIAAFEAYARSVELLTEVIHRVASGDRDSDQRRRPGRRRSDSARQDEVQRLRSIVSVWHI